MKVKNFEVIEDLTTTQYLLIKSCLATNKQEREAYVREWEEQVLINDIDFSSSRLLPFFYHGNQQKEISTKHDNRIKIIYKHWWLRSQHINHQLKIVIAALAESEIKVIIIKGASIKLHYERPELRPMADFDLMIPSNDLHKAMNVIEKLNFIPETLAKNNINKIKELYLDFNHALSYTHPQNEVNIDLHWRLGSHCSLSITHDLWQHLETYASISYAQKPQLAYEVFLIIIHAVVAKNKDNLTWIIDIAVINETTKTSFWKEAREIAVLEKKEDQFDYGCSILIKLGVFAPTPQEFKIPMAKISTRLNNRSAMNYFQLSHARFINMKYMVNRLYPHDTVIQKLYHMSKYFRYLLSNKRFRQSR